MGMQYLVLKFTVITILWLIVVGIQCLWTRFVASRLFGDPFESLVQLCSAANISILMKTSLFHGFYVNGREKESPTDTQEQAKPRPRVGDYPVLETFFAKDPHLKFLDLSNNMLAQMGGLSAFGRYLHHNGDIPTIVTTVNARVNAFLVRLFAERSEYQIVIQPKSDLQQFIELVPTVINDSIFSVVRPRAFQDCLVGGLQWGLQLMYLVFFICFDWLTSSSCIAALIVYAIDLIVMRWFRAVGRANLLRKMLLDDHLFL
jgi:hypothetical protein